MDKQLLCDRELLYVLLLCPTPFFFCSAGVPRVQTRQFRSKNVTKLLGTYTSALHANNSTYTKVSSDITDMFMMLCFRIEFGGSFSLS